MWVGVGNSSGVDGFVPKSIEQEEPVEPSVGG